MIRLMFPRLGVETSPEGTTLLVPAGQSLEVANDRAARSPRSTTRRGRASPPT